MIKAKLAQDLKINGAKGGKLLDLLRTGSARLTAHSVRWCHSVVVLLVLHQPSVRTCILMVCSCKPLVDAYCQGMLYVLNRSPFCPLYLNRCKRAGGG